MRMSDADVEERDPPEWAREALTKGEGPVTLPGHHTVIKSDEPPWEDVEEAVEYIEEHTDGDDPVGLATPTMMVSPDTHKALRREAGMDGGAAQGGGRADNGPDPQPSHPNCRSSTVPVSVTDGEDMVAGEIEVEGTITEENIETIKEAVEKAAERLGVEARERLKRDGPK